jgi:hypothetical protein
MDGQGPGLMINSAKELGVLCSADRHHWTDVKSSTLQRLPNEEILSKIKALGQKAAGKSRKAKKNTKNGCFFCKGILILESSRGGNSHQSETNL